MVEKRKDPIDIKNININDISEVMKNIDINQLSTLFNGFSGSTPQNGNSSDKSLQILNAMKPLVSPDKATIIDTILQIYTIRKILKSK